MHRKVDKLKRTISLLETYISFDNRTSSIETIGKIRSLLDQLEGSLSLDGSIGLDYEAMPTYEVINELKFLYKPTHRQDVFEGDFLEYFGEERTAELSAAGALEAHNEFWKNHETICGNVYGSVPIDLIRHRKKDSLLRAGWEEVDVEIIEFQDKSLSDRDLIRFAGDYFDHYILILEVRTKEKLILRYRI